MQFILRDLKGRRQDVGILSFKVTQEGTRTLYAGYVYGLQLDYPLSGGRLAKAQNRLGAPAWAVTKYRRRRQVPSQINI